MARSKYYPHRIPGYDQKVKPGGTGATGFGGSEIAFASKLGTEGLSDTIKKLTKKVIEEKIEKESTLWSYEKDAEYSMHMTEFMHEEGQKGHEGITKRIMDESERVSAEMLKTVPNSKASERFQQRIHESKKRIFSEAFKFEAEGNITAQKEAYQNVISTKRANLSLDNSIDNAIRFMDEIAQLDEELLDKMSPANRAILIESQQAEIMEHGVDEAIRMDDKGLMQEYLASMEAGDTDRFFTNDPDKLDKLKSELSAALDNKSDLIRIELKGRAANAVALTKDGQIPEDSIASIKAAMIDEYGEESAEVINFGIEIEYAHLYQKHVGLIEKGTFTESMAWIRDPNNTRPKQGDQRHPDGQLFQAKLQVDLTNAAIDKQKAFMGEAGDFKWVDVDTIITKYHPEIGEKLNSGDPAKFKEGIEMLKQVQIKNGTPEELVSLMGIAEKSTLVARLDSLPKKDFKEPDTLIAGLEDKYGKENVKFLIDKFKAQGLFKNPLVETYFIAAITN